MQFIKEFNGLGGSGSFAARTLLTFCFLSLVTVSVRAQEGNSVVRIRINNVDKGTGFLFETSNQVVTALHVVAGASNVTVFSEVTKKTSAATLAKVHKESDLALLDLKNDLGATGLKYNPSPNLEQVHTVWGYPRNVATMQGDRIWFSKSAHKNPTLSSILKVGDKIRTGLKNQGYPSPNVSILRVGSNIQPGHSGAPIIDNNGLVVGIADGGLYGGTARINWAIPALYLPKLIKEGINSSDPNFPRTSSLQSALFSNRGSATDETVQVEFGDDEALVKVMTVPLSEIYDTMDPEDQQDLEDLQDFVTQEFGIDLFSYMIDVYEDFETGATISLPNGISMFYESQDRLLEAWSESEKVEMVVQILPNDRWEDGLEARDDFDDYVMNWSDEEGYQIEWEPDPKFPDEPAVEDDEEGFFYLDKSRIARDEYGEVRSEMFASLIIDENDFLGTAVIAHDVTALSQNDLATYYLMEVCVQLADFTID